MKDIVCVYVFECVREREIDSVSVCVCVCVCVCMLCSWGVQQGEGSLI